MSKRSISKFCFAVMVVTVLLSLPLRSEAKGLRKLNQLDCSLPQNQNKLRCLCEANPTQYWFCRKSKIFCFGDSLTDTAEESFSLGLQNMVEYSAKLQTGCECTEAVPGCTCTFNVDFNFSSNTDFPFSNGYHKGSATNYPGTWARQMHLYAHAEEFSFAFQGAEALVDKGFNFNIETLEIEYGLDSAIYPHRIPGPQAQVELFLNSGIRFDDNNAVAVFYSFGGNDINVLAQQIDFTALDPATLQPIFDSFVIECAGNITEAVQLLQSEHQNLPIVIAGLLALNLTPRFIGFVEFIRENVSEAAANFVSSALVDVVNGVNYLLQQFSAVNPNVYYFDLFNETEQIASETFPDALRTTPYALRMPAAGVVDKCDPYLNEACIFNPLLDPSLSVDDYMWYDEIHPSASTNAKIAERLSDFIDENIPALRWYKLN